MLDYYLDFINAVPPLVHTARCPKLTTIEYRKYLGKYMGPEGALFQARRYNKDARLCPFCKNDHLLDNDTLNSKDPAPHLKPTHQSSRPSSS